MRDRLLAPLLAIALAVAACADPGTSTDGTDAGAGPDGPTTTAPAEPDEPDRPNEQDGSDGSDEADGSDEPAPTEPEHALPDPLPVADPYELVEGETGPAAKQAAAALVQALTTYDAEERLGDVVASATDDPELAEHLRVAAAPLVHEGSWSRGEIIYPQLGGLEDDQAAVITVVRQTVGRPDGTTEVETRTLDVRVDTDPDGRWRATALASAGGRPVPRPDDLDPAAAAVLDDDRIVLPDTARWDIHAGFVDPDLLALMARMADRTPYGVVVLRTGHSTEVFGTDRPSRHSEGRAVDIYLLDGAPVISARERGSAAYELVRWLYDQPELSEVGSPWALDGFGGRSFSDVLHQDHLHVGVLRPGEKPEPPARSSEDH